MKVNTKKFEEWLQWYNENKYRKQGEASIEKRMEFLEKAFEGLFELLCEAEKVNNVEVSRLFRPKGMVFW